MLKRKPLILLGSLGLVIGAVLPWFSDPTTSIAGYEGDGIITGGIGVLLILEELLSKEIPGSRSIGRTISAVIVGAIVWLNLKGFSIYYFITFCWRCGNLGLKVGLGLPLTIIGAALCFVGGVLKVPIDGNAVPPITNSNS